MNDLLRVFVLSLAMVVFPTWAAENSKAISKAETALLGEYLFSLQWISWNEFGKAKISREQDELRMEARQERNGNYVSAEGTVKIMNAREFILKGKIVTRVSHLNEGQPCAREGEFHFRAVGSRKYWRLQEMVNPCTASGKTVDYVDVFF